MCLMGCDGWCRVFDGWCWVVVMGGVVCLMGGGDGWCRVFDGGVRCD